MCRTFTNKVQELAGQSIVMVNKPGAFGILAIEEMARARPDGYTLQVGNVSTNAITPVLFKDKFSIDYEKDVVAIARLADLPTFMMQTAKIPPKTLAEFVAYAKAHPGKVNFASAGNGTTSHLAGEMFRSAAGIDLLPQSLAEALDVMETSEIVKDVLGEHVFDYFIRNKRREWDSYKEQVTPWELTRYLESL